jgi:hypothetical protein
MLRRHVRVEDREVDRMEHAVAEPHQDGDREEPQGAGHQRRGDRPAGEQAQAREQHRPRAEAVDGESAGELRDARADVERADQRAEERPRHVEFGLEDREQRRQRELEEMRQRVREPDEPDHLRVVPERSVGAGLQGTVGVRLRRKVAF